MKLVSTHKDILKESKADLGKTAVRDITNFLNEGLEDASVLYAKVLKAQEYLSAAKEELKDVVEMEVTQEMLPLSQEVERYGVALSLSNTGERLNYDEDPVYVELKRKVKERAEILKMVRRGTPYVDPETGEFAPEVSAKPSTTVLKARIK